MPADGGRLPTLVTARLTARRVVRPAAVWGAVFALYVVASALGFADTYRTVAQRAQVARTFGANAGLNAMIGPARQIDTVAGFTAWRCVGVLSIVGATWGLLTATRMMRGEEEAGRWELLLAGSTTRRAAAAAVLAGVAGGCAVLWSIVAVCSVAVGRSSDVGFSAGAALYLALALVCAVVVFAAVGAVTSQLMPSRRQAAGVAGLVLGIAYALRMIADSGTGLGWLRWSTPLGWIEELRPLTHPQPAALIPLGCLIAALAGGTVVLAGRRDLGASLLADRAVAPARCRLLTGPLGLTVRLVRALAVGWVGAIAVGSLLIGLIARTAGTALHDAADQRLLAAFGGRGSGARAYLGIAFLIVAVMATLAAVACLTALRAEEAEGRLDHLLVRPVGRGTWLVGRIGTALALLAVAGLLAGGCAWAGAASQHAGVPLPDLLEAGGNLLPPAVLVLGAGVLAFGLRPQFVTVVGYGIVAWSFLVEIVGALVPANRWLLDTSIFRHMAAAPAVRPDWRADLVMAAIGTLAGVFGVLAFRRRDLAGE